MAKLTATAPVHVDTTSEEINDTTPVTGEKKLSPKNKLSLGIPAHHKISWVPMDAPAEYSAMLHAVAAVRKQNVPEFLATVLKKALGEQHDALVAEAATYVPSVGKGTKAKNIDDMSDEEVDALVTKAEAAQKAAEEKARQLIAAAKARKAAVAQG